MIGLTFGDTLTLTPFQQIAILVNAALSWWMATRRTSLRCHAFTGVLYIAVLWSAFAGAQIGIDIRATWGAVHRLTPYTGRAFLSELAFTNYLKLQPPLWAWFLSRFPAYWLHQLLALSCGAMLWGMIAARHGFRAAWLVASAPLFQLLLIQPSNDLYAIAFVFAGVLCSERSSRLFGCLLVIFSTYWKYTVYAALPFLLPVFRWNMIIIMAGICGYWQWADSTHLLWASKQAQHYLHIFSLNTATAKPSTIFSQETRTWYWCARKGWRTFLWRWNHLGRQSVSALWWYALPWGRLLTWRMAGFAACVLLGYGNIKYLCLCVLFLPGGGRTPGVRTFIR